MQEPIVIVTKGIMIGVLSHICLFDASVSFKNRTPRGGQVEGYRQIGRHLACTMEQLNLNVKACA